MPDDKMNGSPAYRSRIAMGEDYAVRILDDALRRIPRPAGRGRDGSWNSTKAVEAYLDNR